MYSSALHWFSPVATQLHSIGTHACVHARSGNCAHIAMQSCTHSNDHLSALTCLYMFDIYTIDTHACAHMYRSELHRFSPPAMQRYSSIFLECSYGCAFASGDVLCHRRWSVTAPVFRNALIVVRSPPAMKRYSSIFFGMLLLLCVRLRRCALPPAMQRYSSSIVLLVLLCIVFCAHPKKIPGRKLLGKMRKKRKMRKNLIFIR